MSEDLAQAMLMQFDQLHAGLGKLAAVTEQLRLDFNGFRTELGELQSDMVSLKSSVGSLESSIGTLKSSTGSLESSIGSLGSEIVGLKSEIGFIKSEVVLLRSQVAALQADGADVRGGLAEVRGDLAEVRGDLADIRAVVGASVVSTERLRNDVMARIDRLQDTVTRLSEDIDVNMHAVNRVERVSRNNTDETRDLSAELGKLFRMVKNLQDEVREIKEGYRPDDGLEPPTPQA